MARGRAIANLAVSVTARVGKFLTGMRKARLAIFGFSKASAQAKRNSRALSQAMSRIGGVIGGAAIITGFVRLLRSVESFNQAMNQSVAIMHDVDSVMRERLANTAIEVASTVKFSAAETAKAYFFLASAGLSAQQSIAALPLVAKFAQAGMFDLSRATDLLTDAQSALGLTVKDAEQNLLSMTHVADVLVKANTLANASVQQFSEALTTKAGAALKILGKDIEEGVAVLAAFADQGLKASEAGTGLNIVLRDLTTKAIKNTAVFRAHGIAVFDSAGEMRNLADIVEDVEDAIGGLSDAEAKATLLQLGFTDKSVIFLQTLIGMSDKIREYEKGLRLAGGTTAEVAAKQLTPMQKAVARLTEAWGGLREAITSVNEGLAETVTTLSAVVKSLTQTSIVGEGVVDQLRSQPLPFFPLGGTRFEQENPILQSMARISDITGRIVFVSPREEGRMIFIAKRFEEIQEANEKRAKALIRQKRSIEDMSTAAERAQRAWGQGAKDMKAILTAAENITKEFRTPRQVFEERIGELLKLRDRTDEFGFVIRGLISDKTFDRAALAAEDKFFGPMDSAFDRVTAKAREIFFATRTPLERFGKDMAELLALGLTPDTLARATEQLRVRLKNALDRLKPPEVARIGAFRQVNLSRFALSALSGLRGKVQTTKDPAAIAKLEQIRQLLTRPTISVAG
ncbi:hypothetical protein LCGC14_1590020 [marine sediment metagenome]|uniref:Phage tail tape measure protein domain-containing protein n=1 Tax=marine sediment metagenome TaxID=412755 RepID=A0A0F9IEJ7_9ZZZZ